MRQEEAEQRRPFLSVCRQGLDGSSRPRRESQALAVPFTQAACSGGFSSRSVLIHTYYSGNAFLNDLPAPGSWPRSWFLAIGQARRAAGLGIADDGGRWEAPDQAVGGLDQDDERDRPGRVSAFLPVGPFMPAEAR